MTSRRRIYILVFVISILGLAFIQYQYLRVGINLAKAQFNQQMLVSSNLITEDLAKKDELTFLIGKAITQDESYFTLSLDSLQDASSHYLDDFLKERIWGNGLEANYEYQLKTYDEILLTSPNYTTAENVIVYPVRLRGYLPQLMGKSITLELQFEDLNTYWLTQLNGLTIPSLLFLIAIVATVIWVLRSFYWQRKIITTTNDFINNLTHELKTPVFSIGLATKVLEEKSTEHHNLISMIRLQNDKLKTQIDAVLDLANMEKQKKLITKEKQDIQPVLLKIAETFTLQEQVEALDFNYTIPQEPIFILCNANHLSNAITNLLDNAKKYSNNTPKVSLIVTTTKKHLLITIADEGIGIDKHEQQHVFKKFYRITTGDLHSVKGHGLGLHYVQQVVTLHKGKIRLESEKGKGTTITITLPLA